MNDFSKQTVKALSRKGIRLIGLQAIPDYTTDMPFANATRGYVVDDNGTSRVWTFAEVIAASK